MTASQTRRAQSSGATWGAGGGAAAVTGTPQAWAAAGAVNRNTQGGEEAQRLGHGPLRYLIRAVTARQIDGGGATRVRTAKTGPKPPSGNEPSGVGTDTLGSRGRPYRLGLARRAANKKTRIPNDQADSAILSIARRDGARGGGVHSPGLRRRQHRHDRGRGLRAPAWPATRERHRRDDWRRRHHRRGGTTGAGGSVTGTGGTAAFGEPACLSTVIKNGACTPTDQQFCYKTCGPEKTGVKTETCTTAGTYAEMSGCTFEPSQGFLLLQDPDRGQHGLPRGRDAAGLDGLRRSRTARSVTASAASSAAATSTRAARPRSAGAPARSRTRTACARGPARATRPGRARWAPAAERTDPTGVAENNADE